VLVDEFGIPINGHAVRTLAPGSWLNDEIMNFYFNLLSQRSERNMTSDSVPASRKLRCHFFATFFYAKLTNQGKGYVYKEVQRWTKKLKVCS
jgi:sentrin-specific protease 1